MKVKITKEGTFHVVYDDNGTLGQSQTLEEAIAQYAQAHHVRAVALGD